jgi:hypothetical protein
MHARVRIVGAESCSARCSRSCVVRVAFTHLIDEQLVGVAATLVLVALR